MPPHHVKVLGTRGWRGWRGVFWIRPTRLTFCRLLVQPPRLWTHLDPPPPLLILWGTFFCQSNSLFKPLTVDHNMVAHFAVIGGAGLWVTNICGLGIKSFIGPSRRLTIGAHEALTTELNHKEIFAWCLHKDKVKRGNSTQLDKASVNRERGCAGAQPRKPLEL